MEQARTLKRIWPIDKYMTVVVGVDLKPAGRQRFRGRCPFHSDTNLSLTISLEYDTFRCWSCGASGDIFQATGMHFGIDAFPDQVKKVAEITSSMMSSTRIDVDTYEQTQRELREAVQP